MNLNLDVSSLQNCKALVLHSGGLDSTTALAIAIEDYGYKYNSVGSVSIQYGQRHAKEIDQAELICQYFDVPHIVLEAPAMPKSMLTNKQAEIPDVAYSEIEGVSPTYVPFRNGLFLSYLACIAQAIEAEAIYIGAHAEDAYNDAYPDCSLQFIGTMGAAVYIGTYHQVRIRAPLLNMSKADVVTLGTKLNAPLGLTWSCYKGDEKHCGHCPTCYARKEAFHKANVRDPTCYDKG